jgi:hypothetical protein
MTCKRAFSTMNKKATIDFWENVPLLIAKCDSAKYRNGPMKSQIRE